MIVKEEFLKKLRQTFNLNIYEVKIWTSLLSKGIATAAELSSISNVPRSRSYDVLESLEKKGFVIMKLDKPVKYIAVKPEDIVRKVKQNIKRTADERISVLDNIKGTELFNDLQTLHKQTMTFIKPSELSGSVKGRDRIYSHIATMLKSANKSVTIVTSSKGLIRKLDAFQSTLKKLKNKGVKIRIAAPLNKENQTIAKVNGLAIKNMDKVNARYVIVDNKEVLVIVTDDNEHSTSDIGIWVTAPAFATALENLMDISWTSLKAS